MSISPHQFALPDNPRWVGRWGMSGSVNPYPGMGSSNSVSVGRGWAVNDRITIYGGAYATDNLFYTSRFKNFGVSSRVRVQVAERVFVTGFGNYSIYNGADGQPLPPLMYPGHSFGGSVEVKITDKFGLQAVAERSYNAFTRRWDNSYYVLPVFY